VSLPEDPSSTTDVRMGSAAQLRYEENDGTSYAWVGKVAGVVLLAGLYFGSRGCNRYIASRDARSAAVEALSPIMGEAEAKAAVDRHHGACFEQHYRTGWGRRQSSKFDGEKYAECVIRKLESEMGETRRAERKTSPQKRRVSTATRSPSPPPTPAAASDDGSALAIGDVKVLSFVRAPYLTFHVRFTATGSPGALRHATMCSYVVDCGGKAQATSSHAERLVVPCMAKAGEGSLHVAQGGPATSEGACTMDLALTDGHQIRSNKLLFRLE
jgi:hypothetical protein